MDSYSKILNFDSILPAPRLIAVVDLQCGVIYEPIKKKILALLAARMEDQVFDAIINISQNC
jgi:hypothetical protein